MLKIPELRNRAYREILERCVKHLLKDERVVGLILYGSLARGLEKPFPESDIDLIVVARNLPEDLFERRRMATKIKRGESLVEDLWMTPEELIDGVRGGWGVVLDALEDGIVIYDRLGVISEAKRLLRSLFKRIGRIWVLNRSSPVV